MASPLFKHINKIFILYTLITILIVSIIASIINYSREKRIVFRNISHTTEMFVDLSQGYFNKYNDTLIPLTKKASLLDNRVIAYLMELPLIHPDDHYFILNKDFSVSATTPSYRNFLNLSMQGFDIFKKKPITDVYQSLFTGKSVVSNMYELSNGSILIIERDLHNFIPMVIKFHKKFATKDSIFFVLSGDGEVIYHPDKRLMETRYNLGFELEKFNLDPSKKELQVIVTDNTRYLVHIKELLAPKGWKAVYGIKYSTITESIMKFVILQVLFILCALLLLVFVIRRFINRDVIRPLIEISGFLDSIKSINTTSEMMPKAEYKVREFITITETFNNMMKNIKESYEELSRNEEKFRLLSEFSPVWIYWIDENDNLVYMSSAAKLITGYEITEFEKDPFLMVRIIYSSDRFIFEEHNKKVLSIGHDEPIEYRIIRKDGQIIWIRHLCRKIYNNKGEYLGIRGNNTDITTRKALELELMRQKEELYITLQSIGDGVISVDRSGKILQINKAAEKLTEWGSDEAIGKSLEDVFNIVHEDTLDRIESPVEIVIRENNIVTLPDHTMLISKSGKKLSIAVSAAPSIDIEGSCLGVVLIFRDITDKKALETEAIKSSKLESLSVLAGGIAHDFNNILTAIIGNISLCKYFLEVDSKIYERLDVAERSAEKAKDLVIRLMTFAKGSAPVKKTILTKRLISEALSFLLTGSKSVYELEIQDNIWNIYGDENQITQVLHNILINADQSMPVGGKITVSVKNVVVTNDLRLPITQGRYVNICISDTGVGIPRDKLDKVFDPYFTTKATGSGLGLASTYSIVKKHDGHIRIESKVGKGTTVCVYLPASTEETTEIAPENEMSLDLKGKVLFMDDDPNVSDIARELLDKAGMEVVNAKDGAEAIELYSRALTSGEPFSLVILDLTIPGGMGGKETIKRLYEIDPSVVAIVTSGYSEDIIMSQYKDYGFSGVLKKPFDFKQMFQEIKRVLSTSYP